MTATMRHLGRRAERGRACGARALTTTLIVLVVVGATAGCSPDTPEPPGPTAPATPATPSLEPSPTSTVDPADEAAALDGWSKYWDARIRSINGPDADPALWTGFGTDELIASNTKIAQDYIDGGLAFTGEPVLSDVTVTWVGGAALVVGCVDETNWLGTAGGSPLPPRTDPVHPGAIGVNLVGDTWRVTEDVKVPEGVTC